MWENVSSDLCAQQKIQKQPMCTQWETQSSLCVPNKRLKAAYMSLKRLKTAYVSPTKDSKQPVWAQ